MLRQDVHNLIAGLDPASACVVTGMIVAEAGLPGEAIAKAYGQWVTDQGAKLRRGIMRQYVSKRAAGEPVDSLVELAAAIAKADNGFQAGFQGGAAQWKENAHPRGEGGRFRVKGEKLRYHGHGPLDDADEDRAGVPHPDLMTGWTPRRLTDAQRSTYQQAYLQLARTVGNYRDLPPGMASVKTFYGDGTSEDRALGEGRHLNVIPDKTLHTAEVHIQTPGPRDVRSDAERRSGATFDAVRALTGNPAFAAHLATTSLPMDQTLKDMPQRPGEEYTSAAAFRRMRSGADLLTAAAGPFMPAPAHLATRAASFVGQYGPEAQKVFGPAVDRAKYRYQGTERKLDPKLTTALQNIRAQHPDDPDAAREVMTYGSTESIERPGRFPGEEAREPVTLWRPSPLVAYLREQLPKQHLSALQRMSGRIPPSQGVIIDRQGRVSTQMVGKGDDWYLPFNLGNLGSLQGGEYLRTRTNGGLTTEDVYTGLMAGARSMSVVSHNGLYTMEFDDTLRGSRRYSSTARAMTERYGQLLDAVKSGQVPQGDLDPTVVAEIHEGLAARGLSGQEYSRGLSTLVEQARSNPQPSQAMRSQWFGEFLAEQAQNHKTRSGKPYTVAQLVNEKVILPTARRNAALRNAGIGSDVYTGAEPELQEEALQQYQDNPDLAVGALDAGPAYSRFMAERTRQYRDSVKPMALNGPGYDFAMQALQEQFPYFVSRVKFTPWSETAPDAGEDEGYVKPRFVRPAAARAGYFDETILGHGKIGADQTRYQNYGVMRRLGRSHEGGGAPVPAERQPARIPDRPALPPATPGVTPAVPGPNAPAQPQPISAARQADLDLIQHVLRQDKLSPDTTLADEAGGFGGLNIAPMKAQWMRDDEDYRPLTQPYSAYEAMTDEDVQAAAQHLRELNDQHRLFDLDPQILNRHERRGQMPPEQDLRDEDLADAGLAENHDNEYRLGSEFTPGRTRHQYEMTFKLHPEVQNARRMTGIDSLDDPEFQTKLTGLQLEMRDFLDDPQARRDARSAVMLRQLHRRYHDSGPASTGGGEIAPRFIGPNDPPDLDPPGGPRLPEASGMFRPMYPPLGVNLRGGTGSFSAN